MNMIEQSKSVERFKPRCEFCENIKLGGGEKFKSLYGISDLIETDFLSPGFALLQDIAPIGVDGAHLLLVSVSEDLDHDISLARCKKQLELEKAFEKIRQRLQTMYPENPIVYFEHGPGVIDETEIACGGCHMDHAHGHFVVVPSESVLSMIRIEMERALLESGWINPIQQMTVRHDSMTNITKYTANNPYLHLGLCDVGSNHFISFIYTQLREDQYVESQLLRRIISTVCFGQSSPTEWHWRDITSGFTTEDKKKRIKEDVLNFRSKFK